MDIAAIEHAVRSARAAAIVVDPRLIRRIIKAHRNIGGLGVYVPHAHSYAMPRDELLGLVDVSELGVARDAIPDRPVLVARPLPSETANKTPAQVLQRVWRACFHGQVHLAIEQRFHEGALSDADLRARIDRIGQTEFDEIRAILRHDDHLLPPYGDREAYVEFAALYLELWHFAPPLIAITFPGLERARIDALLRSDVDARALLLASRLDGAEPLPSVVRTGSQTSSPTFSAPIFGGIPRARPASKRRAVRLLAAADRAAKKGNVVRSALLRAIAATTDSPVMRTSARAGARADLEALGRRLNRALAGARPADAPSEADAKIETDTTLFARNVRAPISPLEWTSALFILVEQTATRRGIRYGAEARLLYDLQRAAVAYERSERAVDLVSWLLSRGRSPIVRPLPATRELNVARYMHSAARRIRQVNLPPAERKLLASLLRLAAERADDNLREALRPRVLDVLDKVKLVPQNLNERVARDKLVDELLDQAVLRGRLSLGQLRDALSRNQLKLPNLSGGSELVWGDAPLLADRLLSSALDGVYRRGEIYLRLLQKVSSVAFGTAIGRFLTLYLVLPLGGAFVLLEGANHLIGPLARWLGLNPPEIVSNRTVLATAIPLFGLVHSAQIRAVALRLVDVLLTVLRALFVTVPRWVLRRPIVRRFFASVIVRRAVRRVLVPAATTAAAIWLTPLASAGLVWMILGGLTIFALTSWVFGSRVMALVGDLVLDWLAPTWRTLSHRVFAGAFRLVVDAFRTAMELLERLIYRVDELLRFREGQSSLTLGAKALLGTGWFFIAYVVRLYTTLLVEPELNPVKHFPVVTVAHKLLLPFSGQLLHLFERPLSPLGPVVANAIAGTTAFLVPSVFGFLVWEFKENWKLYRANRADTLRPIRIGNHGETMNALLVPGLHSGTLPKIFSRLRRAAQRSETTPGGSPDLAQRASLSHGRFREALREVEEAVTRFVDRELVALLGQCRRWRYGPLAVAGVELSSNRIRVRIECPGLGPAPCEIAFEEQSELIVASVVRPGFVEALQDEDADARTLFENALAGLYHLAAVDLVREQIEAALAEAYPTDRGAPTDARYDIAAEGLVVWPDRGYRTEAVYALRHAGGPLIEPKLRGETPRHVAPPLDERRILFGERRIAYSAWLHAWSVDERKAAAVPRLLEGPMILPPRGGRVDVGAA